MLSLDTVNIILLAAMAVLTFCWWTMWYRVGLLERRMKVLEGIVVMQGKVQQLHATSPFVAQYMRNPENNDRD